jgi:hypothetical protein
MWEPRRLTTLLAFTVCYRDRFWSVVLSSVLRLERSERRRNWQMSWLGKNELMVICVSLLQLVHVWRTSDTDAVVLYTRIVSHCIRETWLSVTPIMFTRASVFQRVQVITGHLFLPLIYMGLYCYRLCEVNDNHLEVCSFLCSCSRLSSARKSGLTTELLEPLLVVDFIASRNDLFPITSFQ